MKAKNLLVITSSLTSTDLRDARGMRIMQQFNDLLHLAKKFDLSPIVVLGPAGDDVLRICPQLEECDFVFDPNFAGSLFSSVHAGLFAATGAAFVFPLRTTSAVIVHDLWVSLDTASREIRPDETVDVLKFVTQLDGDCRLVFPHLVTIAGLKHLKTLPTDTAWDTDPRIRTRLIRMSILSSAKDRSANDGNV